MTKGYLMNSLIEKMQSSDQDFRFMGLNDLMIEIRQDPICFLGDETIENKVLRQVLQLVEDKISEVKNQAVKCLGQLVKIIRESQLEFVIDKLIDFSSGKDEELRDISALALKTITSELPLDGRIATTACAKLTPKLLVQVSSSSTPPETLIETLSILSILISRFPVNLSSMTLEPLRILAPLLEHQRPVVRKRAILTIAQFVPTSKPELFDKLLKSYVYPHLQTTASIEKQRTTVQLVSAIARHSAPQIAPIVGSVVPGILTAVHRDDDELRESSLQALEALVLRCPAEMTPFLSTIIQISNIYIKYDPNYAGEDGEDEEIADVEGEDDDDEAELDEYSDDEDTSYKIRRSATKLLGTIVGTRPELLVVIYKDVAPILISRFGDREETVRLEIWATYGILLHQTLLYGGSPQLKDSDNTIRGKRKRDDDTMDSEESPYTLLRAQVSALLKALLNQLKSSRSPPTLQAGFGLLHSLLGVLPGCLSSHAGPILSTARTVLSNPLSTSTSTLHLTCLSFLERFFMTHSSETFSGLSSNITPVLLRLLVEKHPRITSDTLRVFSSLLNAMKPIKSADWVDRLYEQAILRLSSHDTDADVRTCAEECIADLWICATDIMRGKNNQEWEHICRSSGKTGGAVKVITKVAKEVTMSDQWVNGCVQWLIGLLRKGGRTGKGEMFAALDVLLKSYTSGVPQNLPSILVLQIKGFISTSDISLLSQALSSLALLLELAPLTTFPAVERELLSSIYGVAHSPLVTGATLDSALAFFAALVLADGQIATHVVPGLVISMEKDSGNKTSPANVAKCIAQVVKSQHMIAAGTIAEYSKYIKGPKATASSVVLSLLILGELGRFIDMSLNHDIFNNAIDLFDAEQEDIRAAAAFAAGNIAIGNLHQFLPIIIKLIQIDPKKRLSALHALKEVVTHCSHGQLEGIAEMLWIPLFENSESSEETTRNVAAACLGKLAMTHPSRYLPQLQARIHDENAAARALVIAAIRYTLADPSQSYDEILAPLIVDFLSLMIDQDLTVRRLALSALNSAARTKPHLIRDHLASLLPNLYRETVVNVDLVRTVQMGPWMHTVDDGLDARKTAYETMYTLLDTCLTKLDLHEFLGRVLPGLSDPSDEIKVICHMMLFKLSQVAPAAVSQRLDDATPELEKTMKGAMVTKDTVKQDLERAAELQRSTLRAAAALSKIGSGVSPKFDAFLEDIKKNPTWGPEFKELAEGA